MNRNEFLKSLGIGTVATFIPLKAQDLKPNGVDCILIPQETAGPYPLDLSGDATKFRRDVTEGRPGIPLDIILTVVNINNECKPIANARIDIWHTDKDGVYSGYNQPRANTVGETFMRGIQITDANGIAEFKTIYPGWYDGRITHIHFQVFLNSLLSATSQMAFPQEITQQVYATDLYKTRGQNTTVSSNETDGVFASPAGSLQYEMLNIISNTQTGGYTGLMVIGIRGPLSGVFDIEPETGGQFVLRQNYPNPVERFTTIEFHLNTASVVKLELFDPSARFLATLFAGNLDVGPQQVQVDLNGLDHHLSRGTYLYQLTVSNNLGQFRQIKAMMVV